MKIPHGYKCLFTSLKVRVNEVNVNMKVVLGIWQFKQFLKLFIKTNELPKIMENI